MHKFERFPKIEDKPNMWQSVKKQFWKFFNWISLAKRSNKTKDTGNIQLMYSIFSNIGIHVV